MSNFKPEQTTKYFLEAKIATGGTHEIYRASTTGTDGKKNLVAIKRIPEEMTADKDIITMFTDEARIAALFKHPNIVEIHDLCKVGDQYAIIMEYVDGLNLRSILALSKELSLPIPVSCALYIASEVCKGIDNAHKQTGMDDKPLNIVWRNLCPKHVMISREGQVKILDFGIAKASFNMSAQMADVLKGNIPYMSPEQAMGKVIDRRSDIFSVGTLLCELLTGKNPFLGDTQFETLRNIRSKGLSAETLPEAVPESLKPIILKALAQKAENRYASAGEMQVDLKNYIQTQTDGDPLNTLKQLIAAMMEKSTPPG